MGLLVAVLAIHMHAEVGEVEAFDACTLGHLCYLCWVGAKGLENSDQLSEAVELL